MSVVTMPHRKDFASDTEHQVKFNLWLKTGGFKGKVLIKINKTDTPNKRWEKDRVPPHLREQDLGRTSRDTGERERGAHRDTEGGWAGPTRQGPRDS